MSFLELVFAAAALGLTLSYTLRVLETSKKRKLGRVVLIGASSGIGKELAIEMSRNEVFGMVLAARDKKKLDATAHECNRVMHKAFTFVADITSSNDLRALLQFSRQKMGGVDTLILCSGVLSTLEFNSIDQSNIEDITNRIFQVNAIGPILATKIFLPELQAQGSRNSSSQIVVIGSASGVIAAPTRTLYTATKHAVTGFFRSLRIELREKDVAICHVMPGSVDTPLRSSALDAKEAAIHEVKDEPIRSPPTAVAPSSSPTTDQSNRSKVMSPQKCAYLVLKAAEKMKEEVYIPGIYQLGASVGIIFPRLLEYLAKRKYNYK